MPTHKEIKAAREAAGLTQQQAAYLRGVDRVTWARYEIDISTMSQQDFDHFCHVAGIKRLPFKGK